MEGTGTFNQDLSSSYPPIPAIAPCWDDLETFNSARRRLLRGRGIQTDHRVEQRPLLLLLRHAPINFEAVLDSSDNTIQFNYGNLACRLSSRITAPRRPSASRTTTAARAAPDPLLITYNAGPNAFINSYTSTKIGVGLANARPVLRRSAHRRPVVNDRRQGRRRKSRMSPSTTARATCWPSAARAAASTAYLQLRRPHVTAPTTPR